MKFFFLIGSILTSFHLASEEVNDPFEDINRDIYEFNEKVDDAVLKPVAESYSNLPPKVKIGITNFFNNFLYKYFCILTPFRNISVNEFS